MLVYVPVAMAGQLGVAFSPRSWTLGSLFFTWCLVPTREVGRPHVRDLPPPLAPHWKPGALRVQLEQGTASSNTLTAVLPRGQTGWGTEGTAPDPSFLGFQEGALPR